MKQGLLIILACITSLVAQDYTYTVPGFTEDGIKVNYMDFRYNTADKNLYVTVEADNSAGKLASGFYFVLSDGQFPTSSGEMAKIYFDASNPNNIVVSSYAYNGNTSISGPNKCAASNGSFKYGSAPGKYTFPDRIASSGSSTSNQLQFVQKSAVSRVVGGVTTVTFYLKLDTTYINQHIPHYLIGTSYKGVRFGSKIGLWGWVASGISSSYFVPGEARPNTSSYSEIYNPYWPSKNAGYLKAMSIQCCAVSDFANAVTNTLPTCDAVTSDKLEVGKTGNINIRVRDAESDSLKIEYDSLPAGFVPAIPNGGSIQPVNQVADLGIVATPNSSQLGTLTFNIKVTQAYGGRFNISCPVRVSIDGDGVKCEEADITDKLIRMDSSTSAVAFYNRVIANAVKVLTTDKVAVAKLTKLTISSDKAHDVAWQNTWSISRVQTTCTGDKAGCTTRSQDAPVAAFKKSVSDLNSYAKQIIAQSKVTYNKSCTAKGKKAYVAKHKSKDRKRATTTINKLCNTAKSTLGLTPSTAAKSAANLAIAKVKEAETEVQTVASSTLCCGKC